MQLKCPSPKHRDLLPVSVLPDGYVLSQDTRATRTLVLPPLWVFPQRAHTSIVGSSAQPRASAGVTAGTLGRASLQASMGVSKCQRSGAHRGGRKACCGLVDIGSVSHLANTNVGQGPKPRCLCSHLLLCDGRPQPTAERCPAERSERQWGEAESVPWLDSSQGVLETPAGLASSAGTRSWRRRWLWGLGRHGEF